jgi:hypothetical protein
MKRSIFLFLLSFFLLQGCDMRKREETIQAKEAQLNQKEQELLLREKTLQLKEDELAKKQQQIDSTAISDTTAQINTKLVGSWEVKMTCTETSCSGSAVGDTKNEVWDISYQDKSVLAKAKVNNELVRVYSGTYNGNILELAEAHNGTTQQSPTKIIVRLRLVNDLQMEGNREIERIGDCKIIYSVLMGKI